MASARLSFSYPEDMKEKLEILAKNDRRSLSAYIKNVLTDHLKETKIPKKRQRRRNHND